MNKENLRMQMLAGIITEGQYRAKLNEMSDEGIADAIEQFGWYFDDGILGGVGSGGAGYYDTISDEISGYDLMNLMRKLLINGMILLIWKVLILLN
jgi:hypothetical protein